MHKHFIPLIQGHNLKYSLLETRIPVKNLHFHHGRINNKGPTILIVLPPPHYW